jgi:two-component system OmpR family response regulator
MKILVIEDDATTREFVSKGLKEHGYIVDEAADGQDGLMMAVSCDYQMIILDRMLPGLDGMKVLTALRAAEVQVPVADSKRHGWSGRSGKWLTGGE